MAYNLSAEGPEANRNASYTAPTNYGGGGAPTGSGTTPPASTGWKELAKIYQYDPLPADFQGTPIDREISPFAARAASQAQAIEKMRELILGAAAKRGITQPEFEWMKSAGQAYLLTPEMFKESSKEWFNKPYNPENPEAIEFRKVLLDQMPNQAQGGNFAKEWGKLHANELTDADKAFARAKHIDYTTPEGVWALKNAKQEFYAPTIDQVNEAFSAFNGKFPPKEGGEAQDARKAQWQDFANEWRKTHVWGGLKAGEVPAEGIGGVPPPTLGHGEWRSAVANGNAALGIKGPTVPYDPTFRRPDFVPGTNYFPTGPYQPRNATEAANLPGAGGTGLAGPPMSAEEYDRIHPVPQNVRDAIAAWRKDHPIPNNEYVNEQNPPAGMTRKQARQANKDMEAAFRADAAGRQAYIQKYAPNEARVYGGALTPYDKDIFASLPDTLGGSPKTPPAPPVTPFVPSGQSPDTAQAGLINAIQRGSTGPPPVGTGNTFLPPYLQPGGINGRRPLGFTEGVTPFDSSLGTPVRETSRTSYEGIPDVGALTGPAAFTPTGALTPPAPPVTPFAPTGQAPGIAVGETPIITGGFMDAPGRDPIQGSEYRAPRGTPVSVNSVLQQYGYSRPAAPTNFLPPYLQPGAGATQGQPSALLDIGAPPGSWDQIINGVQQIPGQITPPGSPLTPFVPQGIAPPGSPLTPFVPQAMAGMPGGGFGGGFAATAKLLELPFYLRNFGKPRRGIYG